MRAHIIDENGLITNTINVPYLEGGMYDADLYGGAIGDSIIDDRVVQRQPGSEFAQQKAAYFAEVREMREKLLNRLSGIAVDFVAGEPPEQLEMRALYRTLRQALLDITTIESVASATTMPQLKAAVKAEYARLVLLAQSQSETFVKAFREVDE